MHLRLLRLVEFLNQQTPGALLKAIGVKQVMRLDPHFSKMNVAEQKQLLCEVLADDWAPLIKSLATAALPHVWSAVKNSSLGRKARSMLSDYLGIDLNDDASIQLGNNFSRNATSVRNIDWGDFDPAFANNICAYDGVNT